MKVIINVGLDNEILYKGCTIETVAGRKNLTTPPAEAVEIVGKNLSEMNLSGDECEITGAMAIWVNLIVFHAVVHRFKKVYYNDGRGTELLVAAHG